MDVQDLLQVLPLGSAILWLALGVWPFLRYHFVSPFQRSLTAFALLVGVWALLDWVFLGLGNSIQPGNTDLAIALSNVRISVITSATFALLLASKWIYFGHSRLDVLLVLPVAASFGLIWTGMTTNVEWVSWGPRLVRDPFRYLLWAIQQVAYVSASIVITSVLYFQRIDLPLRLRRRISLGAGSLFAFLAVWLSTNIYNNVTQTPGFPWFSSLLCIPAAIIIVAFVPLSTEEIGEVFRAVAAVEERVSALYVFYRTGDPLAALGSNRNLPIEPEQLQGVLEVVGNFVETSMKGFRGYAVTALRFDRLGILAVRGQYIIVAAIYDGPVYDALRSEMLRGVRTFEARRWHDLETWEGATAIAEEVADELVNLMKQPSPTRSRAPRPPNGRSPMVSPGGRAPTSK